MCWLYPAFSWFCGEHLLAFTFEKKLPQKFTGRVNLSIFVVTFGYMCRIFGRDTADAMRELTEFGEDRVFNDLRYTINNDKLQELGWREV